MQKKTFTVLLLWMVALLSHSQSMSKYEYWFDQNESAKVQRTASGNSVNLSLDVSELSVGLHAFVFRAQDNKGRWSTPSVSYFLRTAKTSLNNHISKYEYWFDQNHNNKVQQSTSTGIINLDLDVKDLCEGLHSFCYRAQDSNGRWSAVGTHYFVKPKKEFADDNKIVSYQYWFNEADNHAVTVTLDNPVTPLMLDVNLKVNSVNRTVTPENATIVKDAEGNSSFATQNALHIHFLDKNGRWSNVETDSFAVIVENPDLTGFIVNPDASKDRKGWTTNGSMSISQDDHYSTENDKYFHLTGNPATMTQTVSGLPAGTYMLSMMGRSLNGATLEVSINGIEVTFNENEWTSKNLIFTTDGNPFEIKITKTGSGSADIDDLALSVNNAATMTVKLAESANIADYQGMTLELGSDDWTVQQTINSGNACVFNGLSTSKEYSLTLKNQYGMLIASQNNIQLHTGVNTIVLDNLAPVHTVSVKVLANGSQDVTNETSISWYDADNRKLNDGTSIAGIPEGTILAYDVKLNVSLATKYQQPARKNHTVTATGNELTVELSAISMMNLTGQVVNENYEPIIGATITVTQWLNGIKQESKSVTTNSNGTFEIDAYNDSTEIVISAEGYISQTIKMGNLSMGYYLGTIVMEKISGTIISLNHRYQETITEGDEPLIQDWYTDVNDIKYTVYNATKALEVIDFTVQNNEIIIPVALNHGDRIVITAKSLSNQFAEVSAETRIEENDSANVTLLLVELGGMDITYQSKNDDNLIAFVYDTDGKMASRVTFSGNHQKFSGLRAGTYRLVTMGYNGMVSTITDHADLDEMGLENGIDYVTKQVIVRNGYLTAVSIDAVPEMDPSKFSFTSANTSYLSNVSRLVAGKFITMTARVDFSSQYANQVSNISLIVDIPDGCAFVDNSVVIGSRQMTYALNGNKLTIPLAGEDLDARIRFCVVPTRSGVYTTAAFAKFNFRGEKLQPIGSAVFEATDIAIFAPSSTRKTLIPVSGVTTPEATIDVYDNGVLIGSTKALKDGNWSVDCELNSPYNLSTHRIYAEIRGTNGITITTGSKDCYYDINSVEAKSVLMTFYNGWLKKNINVTFDFESGKTSANSYQFYTATDFTFVADLTANDTTSVRGVTFYVYTNQDEVRQLHGFFDKKLNRWVAVSKFESSNLPVNLAVDVESNNQTVIDANQIATYMNLLSDTQSSLKELSDPIKKFEEAEESGDPKKIFESLKALLQAAGEEYLETTDFIPLSDSELEDLLAENQEETDFQLNQLSIFENSDIRNLDDSILDMMNGVRILSAQGLNHTILLADGYDYVQKTDSTYFYVKYTDNSFCMVDISQDLQIIIEESSALAKNMELTSIMNAPSIDDLKNACEKVKEWVDKICEIAEIVSKPINALIRNNSLKIAKLSENYKYFYYAESGGATNIIMRKACFAEIKMLTKTQKFLRNISEKLEYLKVGKMVGGLGSLYSLVDDGYKGIQDVNRLNQLLGISAPCPAAEGELEQLKSEIKKKRTQVIGYYMMKMSANISSLISAVTGLTLIPETAGASIAGVLVSLAIVGTNIAADIWYGKDTEKFFNMINQKQANMRLLCRDPEPRPGGGGSNGGNGNNGGNSGNGSSGKRGGTPQPPFPPVSPIHDPSGYVYEAVTSNRLEGVTATIYSKSENMKAWNAAEYSQVNPIITDETGLYAWDVPQGQWQVRFEKEGYETAHTEWLPVPPPQLEINIPMSQGISPEIIKAHGVQGGITLTFSKYMRPETITQKRVSATHNDKSVSGNLIMVDLEEDPYTKKEYASKVKFEPETPFNIGDVIYITVKKEVESYAGTPMINNETLKVVIESEITGINVDSVIVVEYGGTMTVGVQALPAEAVKGKTISIESGSPMIASVDQTKATLDGDGRAQIALKGELPGGTSLHLSLDGTDTETTSEVKVVISETTVRMPKASVRSGNTLLFGEQITLTCATPGATIYYTLDGSCPCDESKRIKYTQPITINGDVTIKAMAVKDGMADSDIVTLIYVMDDGTGINSVHQKTYDVKWSNGSILVTGAQNATCSVYNTLGHLIAKRKLSTGEECIKVSRRGIFLVAVELPENTSYVYKIVGK